MPKHKTIQFDDLTQVLHNAHLRRSADLGRWLRQYLDQRQTERHKEEKTHLLDTIILSIAPSRRQPI